MGRKRGGEVFFKLDGKKEKRKKTLKVDVCVYSESLMAESHQRDCRGNNIFMQMALRHMGSQWCMHLHTHTRSRTYVRLESHKFVHSHDNLLSHVNNHLSG